MSMKDSSNLGSIIMSFPGGPILFTQMVRLWYDSEKILVWSSTTKLYSLIMYFEVPCVTLILYCAHIINRTLLFSNLDHSTQVVIIFRPLILLHATIQLNPLLHIARSQQQTVQCAMQCLVALHKRNRLQTFQSKQ